MILAESCNILCNSGLMSHEEEALCHIAHFGNHYFKELTFSLNTCLWTAHLTPSDLRICICQAHASEGLTDVTRSHIQFMPIISGCIWLGVLRLGNNMGFLWSQNIWMWLEVADMNQNVQDAFWRDWEASATFGGPGSVPCCETAVSQQYSAWSSPSQILRPTENIF